MKIITVHVCEIIPTYYITGIKALEISSSKLSALEQSSCLPVSVSIQSPDNIPEQSNLLSHRRENIKFYIDLSIRNYAHAVLESTQSFLQRTSRVLFMNVKELGVKLTTYLHLIPKLRIHIFISPSHVLIL
jgi:hypothetical protein